MKKFFFWIIWLACMLYAGAQAQTSYLTYTSTINTPVTLTIASGKTNVDAAKSDFFSLTLTANDSLRNPTNAKNGRIITIRVRQDSTGGRAISYGSKYRFSGGTPVTVSTGANTYSYVIFRYNLTDDRWDCVGSVVNLPALPAPPPPDTANWLTMPITNINFGSATLTPGGYSTMAKCTGGDTAIMIEPVAGGAIAANFIYQNAVLKIWLNGTGVSRRIIDTLNWYWDGADTRDSAHNATDLTPPPRHFSFACADSGNLYTVNGLNTHIKIARTWAQADVNTGTGTITLPGGQSMSPLPSLQRVQLTTSGDLPTGLSVSTDYWLIRVSSTSFRLASSLANARAGTAVSIGTGGTGTDTLKAYLGDHPSDVWTKNVTTSPATFTQLFPPVDSAYVNSATLSATVWDANRRFFIITPLNDQNSGSSQRTYLLRRDAPGNMSRLSQSYNNGDAPGVSSGNGCAWHSRGQFRTFCFGGGNASNPTNRFWRFNDTTLVWDTLQPDVRPRARVQHGFAISLGATEAQDSMWIVGGSASEGGATYNDTWRCNIPTSGSAMHCDSVVTSTIPTAAPFTYLAWMPAAAKLLLRQANGSGGVVDSFYTMRAGTPH